MRRRYIYRATPALTRRFNEARRTTGYKDLDALVRKHTGGKSLEDFVKDSLRTGYIPTMRAVPESYAHDEMIRAAETERIADAFDRLMAAANSDIRAYRGSDVVIPRPEAPSIWDRVSGCDTIGA